AAGGRGCPQDGGEVAEGYLPGGGLPVPVRGGHLAEQGRHGWAFVGEHPYVALRGGQGKRRGQVFGGGLAAGGGEGQRSQRPDLDDAAGAALAVGCGKQPAEEAERGLGLVLGEQHPGQDQVVPFPGVGRVGVGGQVALLRPAGGRGGIAL